MPRKSDREKAEFIKNVIEAHLSNNSDPNIFMAMFLAYDRITRGPDKLDLHEIAKVVAEVFGQQVSVADGYKAIEEMWKKI